MKRGFVFFISLVILNVNFLYARGLKKHDRIRYSLDTISNQNDSFLIKVSSYQNDTIFHEETAFFFDDCIRIPLSRLPVLRDFRVRRFAYRLVNHGTEIYQDPNGKKIVVNYNYGKELTTEYLDSLGNKISKKEFIGNRVFVHYWPIATGQRFFIPGNKKCQKKK